MLFLPEPDKLSVWLGATKVLIEFGGTIMKMEKIVLTILVVLAVGLLALVLMLMKSPLWAFGFPLAFASLGAVCYGAEALIDKLKKNAREA